MDQISQPLGAGGSPDAYARLSNVGIQRRGELRAIGRSLRSTAPRSSHGGWSPERDRPDPIAVLRAQEVGRVEELVPIRYGRMAESPFRFYRGAAAVMAWDLARTPGTGVTVQACGDAHALNFGGYASPERRLVFDINDFDETLPAPWEYDLKRLVASVVLDGRAHGFTEDQVADAVRACVDRYRKVTRVLSEVTSLDIHFAHIESRRFIAEVDHRAMAKAVGKYVRKARRRTNAQAFRKWVTRVDGRSRFVDDPPLLTRLSDEQVAGFRALYDGYRSELRGDRRHLLEQYVFRDAAHKVVGVGSVGLRSYVLLLEGRAEPDPLLLQVKEAVPSVLTPYVGSSRYSRNGQRVVVGQRLMQAVSDPFLGWAPFAGRDYYVRQLRDMKGPSDQLPNVEVFEASAALSAGTLARAHARSVDPAMIRGYLGAGRVFREALVTFARHYADGAERDHERLVKAIQRGDVPAEAGV